jgi:hypothetical protein
MTSIEWLYKLSKERELDKFDLEQAKEMHRNEIEEAFYSGNQIPGNWEDDSTNYYNETFKSK